MDDMPRMKDTLQPEDLNTDACLLLAGTILSEAAQDLTTAAIQASEHPTRENLRHLKQCRDFYDGELFAALSCGVIDGKTAAQKIIREALRGRKVKVNVL